MTPGPVTISPSSTNPVGSLQPLQPGTGAFVTAAIKVRLPSMFKFAALKKITLVQPA